MGRWVGGQSEYVIVPYADFQLFKFPDKDQAMEKIRYLTMLSDIFITGYHGAVSAGVKPGSNLGEQIEQILGTPEVDCAVDYVGFEASVHGTNAVEAPATVISLDEAPRGYMKFDKGAARKYVIDPHGLVK
jgi:glutathione-independent formaldehyde dehydrogenase